MNIEGRMMETRNVHGKNTVGWNIKQGICIREDLKHRCGLLS